jgi:uncharacterized protein
LLSTGRITLPVAEPTRSALMQVRRGEVAPVDVLAELHDQTARLEQAILTSRLGDDPDRTAVDAFLIDAHRRRWNASE